MKTVRIVRGRITGPTSVELAEPIGVAGAEVDVSLQQAVANPLVDDNPTPVGSPSRLDEALLRKRLILRSPSLPGADEVARFKAFSPAVIEGKPLSESIIEDRR